MTTAPHRASSARFICAYRREKSDGPLEGDAEWRGWIARVPDAGGQRPAEPAQKWFRSLDELPALMRAMLEESST